MTNEEMVALSSQLKDIMPTLLGAKDILGKAAADHDQVKALADQIKNLDGTISKLGSSVVELGKKRVVVQNSGLDLDSKIAFAKFLVNCHKGRKGHTSEIGQVMKGIYADYPVTRFDDGKQKAALQEGTTTEGGYLVPDLFLNTIWRVADAASVILKDAQNVPLTRGYKLPIISLNGNVAVTWVNEEGGVQESEPTFAYSQVAAKKISAFTALSNELIEDEEVGLIDLLTTLFGEAIGNEIDVQGFKGTGSPFYGACRVSGVNSLVISGHHFSGIAFTDLNDAVSKVKASVLPGARFYMHRTIFALIKNLKTATTNAPIFMEPSGAEPGTIAGYPYTIAEQMYTTSDEASGQPFILFGNLKNYLVGTKGNLVMKMSDVPHINTDQTVIYFRRRLALAAALPSAFCVIKTDTSS